MTKSQFFACSLYLSDWEDGITYADLLEALEDKDYGQQIDAVTVWAMFERYSGGVIAELIEDARLSFIRAVESINQGAEL